MAGTDSEKKTSLPTMIPCKDKNHLGIREQSLINYQLVTDNE